MVKRNIEPKPPAISNAEWDVMSVLWASPDAPVTSIAVVDAIATRNSWSGRTVKTLLGRLVKKGAVAFTADGNRYLYRAKVRREDCVRAESRSFLARVFGGQTGDMLCRFVDEVELSAEDVERLRAVLDRKAKKKGGSR